MYAILEAQSETVTVHLYNRALKYERIYHSKIIAGLADGTLIYIGPDGHFHVVHGTGPQAAQVEAEVKNALSKIADGVQALADLGVKMA